MRFRTDGTDIAEISPDASLTSDDWRWNLFLLDAAASARFASWCKSRTESLWLKMIGEDDPLQLSSDIAEGVRVGDVNLILVGALLPLNLLLFNIDFVWRIGNGFGSYCVVL